MFFHKIQNRLIVTFILFVTLILLVSAWFLHWMVRQSLEKELGRKLEAVASAASVMLEQEGPALFAGVSSSALSDYLGVQLEDLKQRTDVKRIYVFNWQHQILLNTESFIPGQVDYQLQFYASELSRLKTGQSSHSVLFEGVDHQPTMSGYAPFFNEGQVTGGIGVDGSVTFLDEVNRLGKRLIALSVLTLILAFVAGIVLARTITRPMNQLTRASKAIGEGRYELEIPNAGQSEIGILGQTMEEMRRSILQREESLKAMLAGVAHEIRNPLGGMELFAGLLRDEVNDNARALQQVGRIQKEIGYLNNIVTSFLEFARPQNPRREKIEIAAYFEDLRRMFQDLAGHHQVEIRINCPDVAPIFADYQHMRRILINLIQNALQATPEGGVICLSASESKSKVTLSLSDTGPGIPEENRAHIFTPFFTTREKGTGLGLAIVKGLTEANGGFIELMKSDSAGTVFALTFPKYQA